MLDLTMRADFSGRCGLKNTPVSAGMIQEHLVILTPMNEEGLAGAIDRRKAPALG